MIDLKIDQKKMYERPHTSSDTLFCIVSGLYSYFLPSIPCIQNHPPLSSWSRNTGQPKQLQPLSSISSAGFSDLPRAQKSACGFTVWRPFGLKLGHGPQNCLHIAIFSSLSSTTFISITPQNGVEVTNCENVYKSYDVNKKRSCECRLSTPTGRQLMILFVYDFNEMGTAANTWIISTSYHLELEFDIVKLFLSE